MNRFYYSNICVLQILVLICITIDSTLGQQQKITVWPPKEPEFLDEDNDNIRGLGGRDYPIYGVIPKTSFTCTGQMPGFYADEETDCQVFHLCNNAHKISFLCGNGTVFNQRLFTCNWWYNTTCSDSHKYYSLNAELYKVKEKSNENKQLPKIDNKNANFDNKKIIQQKNTRLPQPTHQFPHRNPPDVIRQNVEQQIAPKPQLVLNNDPVVRHLVLADKYLPEHEEIDSEEYEPVQENGENLYSLSE